MKTVIWGTFAVLLATGLTFAQSAKPTPVAVSQAATEEEIAKLFEQACLWNVPAVPEAQKKLIAIGMPAIKYLSEKQLGTNHTLAMRSLVVIFQGVGKETIPILREKLRDANPAVVINSMEILQSMGAKESADDMFALLKDQKNLSIVLNVFDALASFGDTRVISEAEKFVDHKEESIRINIAKVLANFPDDKIVKILVKFLDDELFSVRSAAAIGLVNNGSKVPQGTEIVNVLIESYKKATPRQKAELLTIFGKICDRKAIDILKKEIKNKDWMMRGVAVEALNNIVVKGRDRKSDDDSDKKSDEVILSIIENAYKIEQDPFVANLMCFSVVHEGDMCKPTLPAHPADELVPIPAGEFFRPLLGKEENAQIDIALHALNMTRKDTEFKKDYVSDPLRPSLVRRFMAKPLELPDYLDDFDSQLYKHTERYPELVRQTAEQMDCQFPSYEKLMSGAAPELEKTLRAIQAPKINEEQKALVAMPREMQDACALILSAADRSQTLVNEALEKLTKEERSLILGPMTQSLLTEENPEPLVKDVLYTNPEAQLLEMAGKVHYAKLAGALIVLSDAVQKAENLLKKIPAEKLAALPLIDSKDVDGKVVAVWESKLGKIIIGGPKDNIYRADAAIIIELGGNDTYLNRAGGAVGGLENTVAVLLDLSGDDQYVSKRNFSQGGAVLGVAAFVDCEGDDIYSAMNFSQSAALFGASLFVDGEGSDRYSAKEDVQSSAAFGFATFVEKGGNDSYTAQCYSQAYAFTKGASILLELGGDDNYTATGSIEADSGRRVSFSQGASFGARPYASGGTAFLVDRKGRDTYVGYRYSQGISYWFALGVLIDSEGDDTYKAELYCQGTGIHLTVGALIDRKGNDMYVCHPNGLAQGSSHDWAVGMLIDQEGNDHYSTSDGGCQGSAITNGFTLFIDRSGNDSYYANHDAQGSGTEARGSASLGIFLDLDGDDFYMANSFKRQEGLTKNNAVWRRPGWGVGVDCTLPKVKKNPPAGGK